MRGAEREYGMRREWGREVERERENGKRIQRAKWRVRE
jgi:hypothetical protein